MLEVCGFKSLEQLTTATVPSAILRTDGMKMDEYTEPMTESDFLAFFKCVYAFIRSGTTLPSVATTGSTPCLAMP